MCVLRDRLFGFMFGSVLAGSAVYTYLIQEYRASNDLLTEDIYVGPPPFPNAICTAVDVVVARIRCADYFQANLGQTLQASVIRLTNYVKALEQRMQEKK